MKAKCTKCQYEWDTKSLLYWITCPRCLYKFKIREVKQWKK